MVKRYIDGVHQGASCKILDPSSLDEKYFDNVK